MNITTVQSIDVIHVEYKYKYIHACLCIYTDEILRTALYSRGSSFARPGLEPAPPNSAGRRCRCRSWRRSCPTWAATSEPKDRLDFIIQAPFSIYIYTYVHICIHTYMYISLYLCNLSLTVKSLRFITQYLQILQTALRVNVLSARR